jgi:uncharacterized delta-60 repeat protein
MAFRWNKERMKEREKTGAKQLAMAALLGGTMLAGIVGAAGGVTGAGAAPATYGGIDPTFGVGGKVTTDFGTDNDDAHGVLVQPDGKIVAAGESWYFVPGRNEYRPKFTLTRYNTNGSVDTSFGDGGKVTTTFIQDDSDYSVANAVARQADGKLIAVGFATNLDAYKSTFAMARYNTDGSLDSSFGQGGLVMTVIRERQSFDDADKANAIAIEPDGKIVLAGGTGGMFHKDFALARYNSDGSLDTSFGEQGVKAIDINEDDNDAYAVAVQSDGKVVIGGVTSHAYNDDFAVMRLAADGQVVASFGSGGLATLDFRGGADRVNGLVIRPDGKIVAGGYGSLEFPEPCSDPPCTMYGFALAQYNTNGTLDSGFGNGGKAQAELSVTTLGNALVRLPDGRLAIAGTLHTSNSSTTTDDFGISIYSANGVLDTSFGNGGVIATNFATGIDSGDKVNALALQADGKVVAAGVGAVDSLGVASDFALARYDLNSGGGGQPTPTTPAGGPSATPTELPGNGCDIPFSDVPVGSTFYQYVQCLACRQILGGYANGTFKPSNNVTRGQLAKIISNAAGFNEAVSGQTFTDVAPGSTFYDYVERMASRNIIGGYSDGTFRPSKFATRGQIAKIAANAAGFNEAVSGQTFSDVAPESTFYEYIERMASRGIIGGYSDGTFRPNNNATRGQTAKITSNAFFPDCESKSGK